MSKLRRIFTFLMVLAVIGVIGGGAAFYYVVKHYSRDLPDYNQLSKYDPPTTTRFYAGDGRLFAEYAKERRLYVPITAIPKHVIHAFLAAEDKNFYKHSGVDFLGVTRAALQNVLQLGQNKSMAGGSTITQQVVKNFLLTKEKTLSRKIKEAILALRITKAYSKDRILELYLNEIYLGSGSYGVAAAALNYFNKSLDELTVEEAAMLASLPKAPTELNPRVNYNKAKERRNWVIDRMSEEGYITGEQAKHAENMPIILRSRDETEIIHAPSFSEAARRELVQMFGDDTLYERGLSVRTTLNPALQKQAESALRTGLEAYDRRHGFRGPMAHVDVNGNWQQVLTNFTPETELSPGWRKAIVLNVGAKQVEIGFPNGKTGHISLKELAWARHTTPNQGFAGPVTKPSDVLKVGDIIVVSALAGSKGQFTLQQIPNVNGAVVVMDPHTGRVLAIVGGYAYKETDFNRAIQAKRQPGSSFKPFIYLKAMERGFTPSTIIVDSPVEIDQGPGLPKWRPQNYSGQFYGPTTLRRGLELSRNAMTVRLSMMLGIDNVLEISKRFNINANPSRNFSTVLGSAETDLLSLTNAYSMIVNGGKRVTPSLIERIQDRNGKSMYTIDKRACDGCRIDVSKPDDTGSEFIDIAPPVLPDTREAITDPASAYQIVSILNGVTVRGTGAKLRELNRTLGGKTGTTNDSLDSWFIGFSPDLTVGVFVGFDRPRTLGRMETGASAALPIFMDFMKNALKDKPDVPFRIPEGVKLVRVDVETGAPPSPYTPPKNIIYEAFKTNNPVAPATEGGELPGSDGTIQGAPSTLGTGGIY